MSSDHTIFLIDLLIILFIIFINSLFVISEISILTSSKAKLHKMTIKKHRGAKQAMRIIQQPEVFLSTMQVCITLMSALLGLFGGTKVSQYLAIQLCHIPVIGEKITDYSLVIASFISLSVITYITVLSEIFPKRLAMIQPEKIACIMSYGINIMIKLIYPLSFILTISTQYLMKFFKIKDQTNNVSVDEIKFVLHQAASVGTIHKTQHDLMRRLMNLMSMQVRTIMTPRNKIISLDINDKEKNNIDKLKKYSFNFFPVINGELNQIIGIVSIKSLFGQDVNNATLYDFAKSSNVVFVPEMAAITKLIDLFSTKQVKTALVVDEYGDIEGIITLNDIMRAFLGDIAILIDGKKPTVIEKSDGSFLLDGNISTEELFELLNITSLPGDEEEDYHTLASFMLVQLGTLPKIGDIVDTDNLIFRVVKMDRKRIDKVLVMQKVKDIIDV
jgi:putative hemolysin